MDVHGRLLIGGMTLNDLYGAVTIRHECECADWCGHLLFEPRDVEFIETRRQFRLELDDGRAGQIIITEVECCLETRKLRAKFQGTSPLAAPLSEPVEA